MRGVTLYSGLAKFYFRSLLRQVIQTGELERPGLTILDFGCGSGQLKRLLQGRKVIGYDRIPGWGDVEDWKSVPFDVLVANEVFYSFSEDELEKLLQELRGKNKNLEIVVGISRQGLLNHIGKYLLGRPGAHSAARLAPKEEMKVLERHCRIVRQKAVFHLADVYSLVFRTH